MRSPRLLACATASSRLRAPTRAIIWRVSGSCTRAWAWRCKASPRVDGSSDSRSEETGQPCRHCQAPRQSRITRPSWNSRCSRRSLRVGTLLLVVQLRGRLHVLQLQHGAVALGFAQFDALDQCAALDDDGLEDLAQQGRTVLHGHGPGLGVAGERNVEVFLQAMRVPGQHGQEEADLAARAHLLRQSLPRALRVALGDALRRDAQVLLEGAGQLPQQALALCQREIAAAGQRLGQRTQKFLLYEVAPHDGLGAQLRLQLIEAEGAGNARDKRKQG